MLNQLVSGHRSSVCVYSCTPSIIMVISFNWLVRVVDYASMHIMCPSMYTLYLEIVAHVFCCVCLFYYDLCMIPIPPSLSIMTYIIMIPIPPPLSIMTDDDIQVSSLLYR